MQRSALFSCFMLAASLLTPAQADQAGSTSLAIISGFPSDFLGLEAGIDLNDNLGIRGGLGGIKLNDVKYQGSSGKIDTFGGFGFVDFYPMGGNFRMSAGTHVGNLDFELSDGTNTGTLSYNDLRPSISVGLTTRESMIVWFGDLGVTYMGKPDLNISGLTAAKQADARDVADKTEYMLMLRSGLGFRF